MPEEGSLLKVWPFEIHNANFSRHADNKLLSNLLNDWTISVFEKFSLSKSYFIISWATNNYKVIFSIQLDDFKYTNSLYEFIISMLK